MDNQPRENHGREPCQCKPPPDGKGPGRNLVVCIDGTSNQFGPKNTNVVELCSQLVNDDTQLTYYSSGIGTYASPSWKSFSHWINVVNNQVDLAIAWTFEKIVLAAYRWLSQNYQDGDRIFLFGFSRGAYQVRVLAGMIDKVGLVHKGNYEQIPFAYELYADPNSDGTTSSKHNWPFTFQRGSKQRVSVNMAQHFKDTFSRKDVRVHFTGVWDTVSSIGILRGTNLPGTVSLDHTCFFRHALALDERRVKYLPEYACGGATQVEDDQFRDSHNRSRGSNDQSQRSDRQTTPGGQRPPPHIKEVWFAGTHSDIGGGNVLNNDMDRRHPAFLWMIYEATSAHLKLSPTNVEWKWDELGKIHESLTWCWKACEWLPFPRLSYKDATSHTLRLHRGRGRKIKTGQKVHASIAFCKNYCPKALLPLEKQQRYWEDMVGIGEKAGMEWTRGWEDLLEMDIFDASTADKIVEQIEASVNPTTPVNPTIWVHRLTVMTWSLEGCITLQRIRSAARRLIFSIPQLDMEVRIAVVNAVTEFVADNSDFELLSGMLRNCDDWDDNGDFFKRFLCDANATQKKVATAAKWAKDPDLRTKMMNSGFVGVLLAWLRAETHLVRLSAIDCVEELATHDNALSRMLQFRFVSALLARLQNEKPSIRTSAIDCTKKLVKHDDARRNMLDSNVVASLLRMFGDKEESIRSSAIDCTAELAKHDNARGEMLNLGIVSTLLSRLQDKDWFVRSSAINCTAELAKHNRARSKLLDSNFAVALCDQLGDKDSVVCSSAMGCIKEFAKHENARCNILNSGVVVALASRFEDQEPSVRAHALDCAVELAKHDRARDELLNSNVVAALLSGLRDNNEGVCRSAFSCTVGLAMHDIARCKILDSDIIIAFARRLGDEESSVRLAAIDCAEKLATYADTRRKMLEFNIVGALMPRLEDTESWVRRAAFVCSKELAKDDDARREMSKSGVVAALLHSLADRESWVRWDALDCTAEFAKHDRARGDLLDSDVVAALLPRLQDENENVCRSALKCVTELAKHDDSLTKLRDAVLTLSIDSVRTVILGAIAAQSGDDRVMF